MTICTGFVRACDIQTVMYQTLIHTYTYIYIHIYIHTCIRTYIHMHIYIHTYIHTHVHTYIHTYSRTCTNYNSHVSDVGDQKLGVSRNFSLPLIVFKLKELTPTKFGCFEDLSSSPRRKEVLHTVTFCVHSSGSGLRQVELHGG